MKHTVLTLSLIVIAFLAQSKAGADEFECAPNKSGWAVVNKTTNKIIRTGSSDFSYRQDCEKSVSLANRKNSIGVICSPYNGGVAITNHSGKNLSPREAVFHDTDYCLKAVENVKDGLLCIPDGEDLYVLGDFKINKYILQENRYRLLNSCLAGAWSASVNDNYICASHVNNDRHYHIYDRTTGEKLTETSYGKISSCVRDLRGQ